MIRGTPHLIALLLLAALAILLVAFTWSVPPVAMPQFARVASDKVEPAEPLSPLPRTIPTPGLERAQLGERLFHELRLSGDDSVACASCHSLEQGGADGRARSVGAGGALGEVNAPSVFNAALGFAQFWDGRAATLAEQIDGPLHNPVEMASDWPRVLTTLSADEAYRTAFAALYPDGITKANIVDALVRYQLTLVTPNAPFDRYLRGERDAIDAAAREGYARFKDYGCASCHQGALVGGNMFQRFGIMGDYFVDRGQLEDVDLGRYRVTGREEDRYVFKVPSLRNVALTAPYFHDGSVETLDEAVEIMARYQLGRDLQAEDIALIVAFLNTLTGDAPNIGRSLPLP